MDVSCLGPQCGGQRGGPKHQLVTPRCPDARHHRASRDEQTVGNHTGTLAHPNPCTVCATTIPAVGSVGLVPCLEGQRFHCRLGEGHPTSGQHHIVQFTGNGTGASHWILGTYGWMRSGRLQLRRGELTIHPFILPSLHVVG